MLSNSVAPLLLTIQQELSISVAASAIIPLVSTISVVAANIIGSMFIAQIGNRTSINLALALGGIGSLIFAGASELWMLCLAVVFIGAGTGILFMGLSTQYSHLEEKYQNFGLFHAFFGFGGITSPLLVSVIQRLNISYSYLYLFFAFVLGILFFASLVSGIIPNVRYERIRFTEAGRILKKPVVYLTYGIFFFYAGSEIGVITWNGNLFHDGFGTTQEYASLMLSIFWAIFTGGRILADIAEKKVGMLALLKTVPVIIAVALGLLLFTGSPFFLFIIGLGLAPVFPVTQKYGNKLLPGRESGLYNGLVFAFSAFGSAVFVPIMGVMAEINVFSAYIVPVLCAIAIFAIVFILSKVTASEQA